MHLLGGDKSGKEVQYRHPKVNIPNILAYGIENELLKKAVVWAIARLKELKVPFTLDDNYNTKRFMLQNSASDSDFDVEGYRLYFQYIATLRFEGFSRTANKLIQKLQKYPQYGEMVPKVKTKQMEAANKIF